MLAKNRNKAMGLVTFDEAMAMLQATDDEEAETESDNASHTAAQPLSAAVWRQNCH